MATESRPKVRLDPSQADWILEGLALTGLLMLVLLPTAYYGELPDIIPQHFNARGDVDDWGPKSVLWLLPAVGLGLYLLLTLINRWPHIFNYPVKITPENAARQYQLATRLIRVLKAVIMLVFSYLCWGIIQSALAEKSSLGPAFLWITLGLVFGTIGWYVWTAFRGK